MCNYQTLMFRLTLRILRSELVNVCAVLIVVHRPDAKDTKAGACPHLHHFDCTALIVLCCPDPKDPKAGTCPHLHCLNMLHHPDHKAGACPYL